MDAKPQRPLRTIRVREDENVPPILQTGKTIHQRNKSSPALSTMLGAGGIKAAAKRTAFGDVSNTFNGLRPSKDDTALAEKPSLQLTAKPAPAVQEKKSAAFLRPAQRPLSVSGLKGLLTGNTSNGVPDQHNKVVVEDPRATNDTANVRKVLTKRNTTVFKDSSLETVEEVILPSAPQHMSAIVGASQSQAIVKPVPTLHASAHEVKVMKDPIKASQRPRSSTDAPIAAETTLENAKGSSESNGVGALRSDGIYIDQKGEIRVYQEEPPSIQQKEPNAASQLPEVTEKKLIKTEPNGTNFAQTAAPLQQLPSLLPQHQLPQTRAEPQEYWEEEEEEDNYDGDGYVTARSYRSKGDNTTGGATTILFPHINQQIKREVAAAKQLVDATRTPEEIEDECFDTSMVAEYGDEIFDYMKSLEVKMLPNAHYMDNQHEIQWSMRAVLMDWLVQVHHCFNLLPETLFLCVNYIDRFLSCKVVSLGKLQLVGATAIFIAAKYEEINCPSVQEIVYMVDGGYTIDEILKAERFMLTMLQFELGWPGPMSFLRRISKADDYDLETRTLAKYFLEVTIMDERFIGSPPSFTAAGSHCLARLMLHKGQWSQHHVYYSNYTLSQLMPMLTLILECCENPRKHHAAVYNKYCDKRYKRASAFVETEIQRGFTLSQQRSQKETISSPTCNSFDNLSYFGWEG